MISFGFVGAGLMGSALIRILMRAEGVSCLFFDVSEERCAVMEQTCGLRSESCIADVVTKSDVTVIAVKPQMYPALADEIGSAFTPDKLMVSIMAGISTADVAASLPRDARVIRLMPNMAMELGAGVCLLAAGENALAEDIAVIKAAFASAGLIKEIPERLMDAGTAVSGSGPAFFYSMAEAMMLGGIRAGFTKADAGELTAWTMKGAAALLTESGKSAAALRDEMMSAGGTTVEGICVLEEGSFRGDVIDAVGAACRRSKELSEGSKK